MFPEPSSTDVTQLLLDWRHGDEDAFGRLLEVIYHDLGRVARGQLRRSRPGATLDTVGLINEAYLRLVDSGRVDWQDRGHFLAVAARAMRQVIVEHARRRAAAKRGGGEGSVTLDAERHGAAARAEQVLVVSQALETLARRDERLARIVECRFFAGLSAKETAATLGLSLRTAQRDWMRARAWLKQALRG